MAIRGIGVEGVVSEIGALCRRAPVVVDYDTLVQSLCRSFSATPQEAEDAINWAKRVRVVVISHEADGRTFCHMLKRRK